METLIFLRKTIYLNNGEHFIFGRYANYPIEWIKLSKDSAIAACILEKMAWGREYDYENSCLRVWCNELCEKLGYGKDVIYIPHKYEFKKWRIRDNELKCDYSEELKERGEDDGNPIFWTNSSIEHKSSTVRTVTSTGSFSRSYIFDSDVGVRPAIHIGKYLKY